VEGEDFYSVEEAARALRLTPERVEEILRDGELEGIPPEESGGRGWRIPVRVIPYSPPSVPPPRVERPEGPPASTTGVPVAEDVAEEAPETVPEHPEPPKRADTARGDDAATDREPSAPSGWVTTQQAARALGISPRTVRWHIEQGNLEAMPEGEGVKRAWLVSIDSLHAFRDSRQTTPAMPRDHRAPSGGADIAAESPGSAIRELADRLVEEAARASEFRVRLEIAERAQSSLEDDRRRALEGLAGERRRREGAERERDELRRRLEAPREPRESPTEPAGGADRVEARPAGGEAQEATEKPRPWWRRVFGG
jgi:helix-turn-helix protein